MMSLLIICPESLVVHANQLARAIGSEGDERSFRMRWTKDGQTFYVCNFGALPNKLIGWLQNPHVPFRIPDTVNRDKCKVALAAFLSGDIYHQRHSGNPAGILESMGYSRVEPE